MPDPRVTSELPPPATSIEVVSTEWERRGLLLVYSMLGAVSALALVGWWFEVRRYPNLEGDPVWLGAFALTPSSALGLGLFLYWSLDRRRVCEIGVDPGRVRARTRRSGDFDFSWDRPGLHLAVVRSSRGTAPPTYVLRWGGTPLLPATRITESGATPLLAAARSRGSKVVETEFGFGGVRTRTTRITAGPAGS